MSEGIKPCTKCSSCGFYLDYAGPGIAGGIKVDCSKCEGRGWVKRDGSPLDEEPAPYAFEPVVWRLSTQREVAIAELIKKYESSLAAHKSGEMMSLDEAVYGQIWCERILKDLRILEDIST